jgi:hypothetical protein
MKLMPSETLDRLLDLVLYRGGRCAQHVQDSEHAHPSQVQLAKQHHGLRCVKALESRHLSTRLGVLIAVICFLAYAAMAQQVSCKVKKCCSVSSGSCAFNTCLQSALTFLNCRCGDC